MNNKSQAFTLILDSSVKKGQIIKYEGKSMIISTIKEVTVSDDGKLVVSGLWKENPVDRMIRKFAR